MHVEEIPNSRPKQWKVTDAAGHEQIVTKAADKFLGEPAAVHAVLLKLGKVHSNPAQKSTK